MLDERLLEILVCPKCKGNLEYIMGKDETLICHKCSLAYPVKDDIPVMLIEEAKVLSDKTTD